MSTLTKMKSQKKKSTPPPRQRGRVESERLAETWTFSKSQKVASPQRLTPLEKVEKSKKSKLAASPKTDPCQKVEKVEPGRAPPLDFFRNFIQVNQPSRLCNPRCAICRSNIHQHQKKRKMFGRTKQIVEDRAEPQQIVATRPLYCLQHPLPIQVVCKRFFPAHIGIAIHEVDSRPFRPLPVPRQLWYTSIRDALFLLISYKRDQHHRFQHRFWLRGVQPLSSVW